MPKFLKNRYSKLNKHLAFFVLLLMFVFILFQGNFVSVQASSNKVNIIPGLVEVEQGENGPIWNNINESMMQDLSADASLEEFNISNSAYLISDNLSPREPVPDLEKDTEETKGDINPENDSGLNENVDENEDEESKDEANLEENNSIIDGDEEPNNNLNVSDPEQDEENLKDTENNEQSKNEDKSEIKIEENSQIEEDSKDSDTEVSPLPVPDKPQIEEIKEEDNSSALEEESLSLLEILKNKLILAKKFIKDTDVFAPKIVRADLSSEDMSLPEEGQESLDNQNIASEVKQDENLGEETTNKIKQSLIFSDFSLPLDSAQNRLNKISLNASLAAQGGNLNDKISFDYSLGGDWEKIKELNFKNKIDNSSQNIYFQFDLPENFDWEDIDKLSIRVSYLGEEGDSGEKMEIYLDSLWLGLEYDSLDQLNDEENLEEDLAEDEEEPEVVDESGDYYLDSLQEKRIFKTDELPEFELKLKKKRKFLEQIGAELKSLIVDKYKDTNFRAEILDAQGKFQEIDASTEYLDDGKFKISLNSLPRRFKPGAHQLKIEVQDSSVNGGRSMYFYQNFIWGVLAINTNKSIYAPEEKAYLQMAVLDEDGNTLCNADLNLEITAPDGGVATLSSENGLIIHNPDCGPNNVINTPDYYSYYSLAGIGVYNMKLKARTENGEYEINDSFEVREDSPFDIERIGPTRIYPWADYDMQFRVRAQEDFKGIFSEYLPEDFLIVKQKNNGRDIDFEAHHNLRDVNGEKRLVWKVDWKAGQEYILAYSFDAPDVSPEFYLLGPADAKGYNYYYNEKDKFLGREMVNFAEIRKWQIASDALQEYSSSGTFVVPLGVSELTIKAWGAGGGGGECDRDGLNGGNGGGGGFISGTISVTPLETLNIDVGTGGTGGPYIDAAHDNYGGLGGGGGGYSAVRRGVNYLFVAGAGGGGGGSDDNSGNSSGGNGGAGGGENGIDGADSGNGGQAEGGYGASQTAGGAGGNGPNDDGAAGSALAGGDGGGNPQGGGGAGGSSGGGAGGYYDTAGDDMGGAGGGGAGWYGGGGGANYNGTDPDGAAGGGGGSSWAVSSAWATSTIAGSARTAGSSTDPNYANNAGQGGVGGSANNDSGDDGNDGRVVILYTTPRDVTVSASGTQKSTININSEDNYLGGTFVLKEELATSTVSSISINETGTVDAQNDLSNIRLYYDLDSTAPYDCASESYNSGDLQFGSTSASFDASNGTSTFSGSVNISTTSTMCVYVVLDVDFEAEKDKTVEVEITDPSREVVLSSGVVMPATSVSLPGTTNLYAPDAIALANKQRKSDNFTDISNQGWTNEDEVNLLALAIESEATTSKFDYYFELLNDDVSFSSATSAPASFCSSGSSFGSCSSKIWMASASTTEWYNTDWKYRKRITINATKVYSTETNFVVLATTSDSDLMSTSTGGHVEFLGGDDILFVDDDGTVLDYEREYYDNTTGDLVAWIETDISSTTNKSFYIYYGNNSVSADQQNINGTWDGDYTLVNHLNDDPGPGASGDIKDSTSNANDATAASGMTSDDLIRAKLGLGIDFDGVSDSLTVPDSASMDGATGNGQARTWSYWLNFTTVVENTLITDKSNFAGNSLWSEAHASPNKIRGGTDSGNQLVSETTFSTGKWYYIVYEHDGSYDRLYVNGVLDDGPNAQTADNDNNNSLNIMGSGNNYEVNGVLDELRITNVSHSATWIKTEYSNQNNVKSFLNFGDEENIEGASYEATVNIISLPDRGSESDSDLGYKWQILACNDSGNCSFWDKFNSSIPNFKVDTNAPSTPGNLSLATSTHNSLTLNFGAQSSDANFNNYKIFYKDGLSGVDTSDIEHLDDNLNYIDYNGVATTTIRGLEPGTQYVINIWAYDLAGNKTGATELIVSTKNAPHARARSVQFLAGNYSGDGSSGQLTDTNQTFSTFNFSLAETGVEIKNAYLIFESQFAAYSDNTGDYTGYNLAFDACAESCTADAFSGSGRVLEDDNSVLVYSETESNQIRLLLDVSDELQLAAYEGDGNNMEAQVGYRLETGTATTSIASAKAILIINYSFNDDDSDMITNTVIYPLESKDSGDSGSRQSSQSDDCTKDSNCPLFDYDMNIPELDSSLDQWFQSYGLNDGHNANDVSININIEGTNIDSDTFVHESANGGTQGILARILFENVSGFSENTAQTIEYHLTSSAGATYYALGGEVLETYTALKSAGTKTRTVSFPIGVITKGNDTTTASGTVEVYFPENGSGSGIVDIQKAWFRVLGDNYNSGAYTLTISSKVGDNTQSGNYAYNLNSGGTVIKPSFNLIHVIPSSDYLELEAANKNSSKKVIIYSTNSSADMGGVSAELMITYAYTDESSGYLASMSLYGGQSNVVANSQELTLSPANSIFPELKGDKILRSSALLSSFLLNDSDGAMPSEWFSLDVNIASSSPSCSTSSAFISHSDSRNSFSEFYKDVSSALNTNDDQEYSVCMLNYNPSDDTVGAKMNTIWNYTYEWDAPPVELTQNDWRWYENVNAIDPITAKAAENTAISGVNIGDVLHLRMNIGISKVNLATSTKTFKLQYADNADCTNIASTSWKDVGAVGGLEAWLGYNNPDPDDGISLNINSEKLNSSNKSESYEEVNPSVSNPRGVSIGEYGEWAWMLYNNSATSSSNYCFRMINSDGTELDDYLNDSYPKLVSAPANTAPNTPTSLEQYESDGITVIPNLSWIKEKDIKLRAEVTDPNMSEVVSLYFEIASSSGGVFTSATSVPSNTCSSGTAYNSCDSKIWAVSSTLGDYRTNAFTATASITSLLESSSGYKWQVMACDDDDYCSLWNNFNSATPNFKIDISPPTSPGDMTFSSSSPTSITLNFGSASTEDNFSKYKIFYKVGSFGVDENDSEHSDINLMDQNYNGKSTTTITNLSANTAYVFNIWAYDVAGNKASATHEVVGTTTQSFNPPTGYIDASVAQKTDGSGIVDMTILVDDPDNNDTLRAKVFYEAGNTCAFSSINNMTIDETDANISATYGDPDVDNNSYYQVGTSTSWILTSPGSNYVLFDWLSDFDVPTANGQYCLGLVVNDGGLSQVATHTKVIILDNVDPLAPGNLSLRAKAYDNIRLNFGTESSDTNFAYYKIFYKEGSAGLSEADSAWTQAEDPNLGSVNYGGAASTTVSGLNANTTYVFNIWAYDDYGNKASSSVELSVKTNAAPINISADNQYLSDATTLISNGSWIDENNVLFKASAHDQDAGDLMSFYFEVITATGTFSTISSPPSETCASGTAYLSCSNNIWIATTTSSSLPSDWYSEDWLYRKKITLNSDQIKSTVSDFPVFIDIIDSDLATYARGDAYDVLFTDSSGTTTLNYEREYYDSSAGELSGWLKSDISSTTDTEVYMYYGNSGSVVDKATTTGVWDSNYKGVWHLAETVVDESNELGVHKDSTLNHNNGDQYGNNEVASILNYGQSFDGIDDYIEISDDNVFDFDDALTISFWINGTITNSPSASSSVYSSAGASSFVVPDGVEEISVKLWGGGGGGGAGIDGGGTQTVNNGGHGGGGGFVEGTIAVVPGETIDIIVGGGGSGGQIGASANGGGGGGGGGRSEITISSNATLVAAGGGGGGGANDRTYAAGSDGGPGGGESGTDGTDSGSTVAGGGASQSAGGSAGTGTNDAQAGSSSVGGDGADGRNGQGNDGGGASGGYGGGGDGGLGDVSNRYPGGGGGGSGYYGGGGGGEQSSNYNAGAGGGGGSSYVLSSLSATSTESGSGRDAGNNSDDDYNASSAKGGTGGSPGVAGTSGSDGYVIISFNPGVNIFEKGDAYKLSLNSDGDTLFGEINDEVATTSFSSGWHYLSLSYDRNAGGTDELKLFVDGDKSATADFSDVINTNNDPLRIGGVFNGKRDEIRISDIARSEEWIKSEYNNQSNVSNFLSFSSQSTVTSYFESVLSVNIPDNPDFSSGYKWQVMACDDDQDCTRWDQFNASVPNFKIDTTLPSPPGALSRNVVSSNAITLNFGAQTDEDNFTEYKIYYGTSSSISELDNLHSSSTDSDLAYIDYNSTTNTTISGLDPEVTYYFNIWAYDVVGHKSSSSVINIATKSASSSPGVFFYTKNDQAIYYNVWDGSNWGGEKSSSNLSGLGDNIRHIRTVRSDDGGKVAILFKTWDGTNQKWWATVYRYAADDFVNTTQLGSAYASSDNNQLITGCLASFSGGEFMIIRNNNGSDGTLVYSWNYSDGWTAEGAGPDPLAVLNGCELVRRPNTDNYILMTYDDDKDLGSSYYYGGSSYSSSWTAWSEHSTNEDDADNYVGQAFFDPSDNSRGALSYSNSATNHYAYIAYFTVNDTSINYGGAVASPRGGGDDWANDFVHGEFASDPSATGIAYYAGRDIDDELNIYKIDISNPVITWATTTNGDNISSGNLYDEINDSQKPFALTFYKGGEGVIAWNNNVSATPKYRKINSSNNSIDSSDTAILGADANIWTRARFYNDPSEDEFIAIYQNDDVDYSAVFWDTTNKQFYSSGNQSWNELVTNSGAGANDESASFAYMAYNSPPNALISLEQYKIDGLTVISNQGWTSETSVKFNVQATDPDTYESISLYLNLVSNIDDFSTSTNESAFNACASTTAWDSCSSKIWKIATSTNDDYSLSPFTATATISSLSNSSIGYKWQALACDDENDCSAWSAFNATQPNFYVDNVDPTAPGNLSVSDLDSSSVTLNFASATEEDNFSEYKIFYKIGASGVSESDNAWTQVEDANLALQNYGGATQTTISGLASSTQYVFNIWAYDLAGNTASATLEISTTTSALANIVQSSYLFENDDGSDVNSNTAPVSASTTLSNVNLGQRINVRIQIENNGGDISSNKVYKLQFDTDYDGNWTDLGASTALSYGQGMSGANNDSISGAKAEANSNTWADGTWQEGTNLTFSYSLEENHYTEFVFNVETSQSAINKTYRFRLYNNSDDEALDAYNNYPIIKTVTTETKKYSKDIVTSLDSDNDDLKYFLDAEGYDDLNSDDASRDTIVSFSQIPVYNFVTKHTNNTDALSIIWNGQSTYSPALGNVFLEVYRFGSTNDWVVLDTEASAGADTDFNLSASINSKLSEYYDSNNYVYCRVYQESGTQTLSSDYFYISFSAPVAEAKQLHYRWRADDGDEAGATWLENEDTGSPSSGSQIGVGSTTRVRIEVANLGGGTATNYNYRLEYASSSDGCVSDFGTWTTVPVSASANEHFEMVDSSYFDDASTTSARFSNAEGYTYVNGDMIEDPSNSSANITLSEDRYTELEYVFIVTTDAQDAMTYCFRVSNSGTLLSDYDTYPLVTLSGNTNTAPSFTASPSDNGSASTSPTNYNNSISFSATASDGDGDSYYLAICKTNSVSAGVNAPPTCGGGDWCISGEEPSASDASCEYQATSSSESLDWYAFACDKVSGYGIAKCSSASQGSGTLINNSPFVINHPPNFTSASTTDNNKDPGGTFVITANVTDTDTVGGADTIDLFVCSQDSAAAGVGCTGAGNIEFCSESATTSPNASCSFATSSPALAGDWTYYAFVFDNHNLAADANSQSGTYTVNNVAPILGSLILNNGSDITLSMKPNTTNVESVNTSVVDNNGCSTIISSVGKVYMSNVANGYNCTADNNDCYHASVGDCNINCTDSVTATITCDVDLEYYAIPTDDATNNPYEPYYWVSYMQVYDGENYAIATSSGVDVLTTIALELNDQLIDFGTGFAAGENTGTDNASTTLTNIGNSPINTRLKGTDLSGNPSGTITVDNIKYDLSNFDYVVETNNLSTSDQTVNTLTPRATSSTDISDEVYWGIGIPYGSDASTYYGQNTFTVQLDTGDWN